MNKAAQALGRLEGKASEAKEGVAILRDGEQPLIFDNKRKTMHTTKARFRHRYRLARCQSLGTLATTLPRDIYDWFLSDVYDLRFPRICVQPFPRTFDSLERKPQHAYYMPVVDSKGNRFVISGGYKRIAGPFIKFGNDILKRLPSPL